jgi:hypothetical protein
MDYFMNLIYNADRITVTLPKTSVGRSLCKNMTLEINYLNDSQLFQTIQTFSPSEIFGEEFECIFVFEDLKFDLNLWRNFDNNMALKNSFGGDYKYFRAAMKLRNLPQESTFSILTYNSAEITQAGLSKDVARSQECETG